MRQSIGVSVEIDAPPERVWARLADVHSHVDWMHDALAVRILSDEHGVGMRFECDTKVGPLRLTDTMEITEWTPPEAMGVRHTGAVTGEGRFWLAPIDLGRRTRFGWCEKLRFPWWLGGRLGSMAAAPVLRRIWRSNLRSLKALVES